MIKELARTEEQYDLTLEELAQALLVNQATRENLEAEEEKTLREEDALRVRGCEIELQSPLGYICE